jgi:hypothetical protein
MSYLGGGTGTPRPDVNEMSAKEKLHDQEERVHQQMLRDEVAPTWWSKLLAKLSRRPLPRPDGS